MQASGDSRDQRRSAILIEREFDIGSLGSLRHALRELIVDAGVDTERAETFTFAINEGLINAIMHGGGHGDVSLVRNHDRLVAVVEDQNPTKPFELPQSRPEPATVGGRGLWLISRSCDAMRLERGDRGLRLVMELALG